MRSIFVVASLVGAFLVSPVDRASAASAAVVTCRGHAANIVGTSGDDVLIGTAGNDYIAAGDGNDAVHGGGGNDVICGGPGADRLWGNNGDDRLFGGDDWLVSEDEGPTLYGDSLDGGLGDDWLVPGYDSRRHTPGCICVYRDVLRWTTSTSGVLINTDAGTADGGAGHDTFDHRLVEIDGSPFGDVVDGTTGPDQIKSGDGNDLVRSYEGNDSIWTDPSVYGGGQHGDADRVWSGPGNDNVLTGDGPDLVYGGLGNDVINDSDGSAGGINQLFGEDGNDVIGVADIVRTSAPQRLSGGTGKDQLNVGSGQGQGLPPASWNMGTGAMTIHFPNGTYDLVAEGFEDAYVFGFDMAVRGTDGPNRITAGNQTNFTALGGNDTFQGSFDDDTFDGGPGTDHSLGMGDGNDTCISVEVFDKSDCENIS